MAKRRKKSQQKLQNSNKQATQNFTQIEVKNADGYPDTKAKILVQNELDFKPKISVIIPVYNTEKYLRECLESVMNQSLKEIEIICVDDGSSDKSLEILKEFANKDKRISVLTQQNLYAGVARNAGMMVAKGEYLHFMDSDDWLEIKAYEEVLKNMQDAQICVFSNRIFHENTQEFASGSKMNPKVANCKITSKKHGDNLFFYTNPNAWTKIFKTSFIKENNLKFQSLQVANDITFTYSAMLASKSIYFLNQELIIYRSSQKDNLTANRGSKIECFLKASNALIDELAKNKQGQIYKNNLLKRLKASFVYELKFYDDDYEKLRKLIISMSLKDLQEIFLDELKPKISVIICVYNGEKYIQKSLNSAINQTLKEIEIICVNDGSSDNSLKILDKYAKKDNRIKLIDQKNQGLAISRNNAFKIVSGRYVQYLDADDYLDTKACEKLFKKAFVNDLDMLCFSAKGFKNSNEFFDIDYYDFKQIPSGFKPIFNINDCKDFCNRFAVASALTLYKKDFLEQLEHKWIEEKLCYEDNLFFTKAFIQAKKISILNEKIYFRRYHDESITQNISKNFADKIKITELLLTQIKALASQEIYNKYFYSYTNILQNDFFNFDAKTQEKYFEVLKNTYINLSTLNNLSPTILTNFNLAKNNFKSILDSSRIDIKHTNGDFKITQLPTSIQSIRTEKSNGYKIKTTANKIRFKTIKSGKLVIEFKQNDNFLYKNIYINGKKFKINSNLRLGKLCFDNQVFDISFDYEYKNSQKQEQINAILKRIKDDLSNSQLRIDIKNLGSKNNDFEIIDNEVMSIQKPEWLQSKNGHGTMLLAPLGKHKIKLKAKGSGCAKLRFMNQDFKRELASRPPIFIAYDSIKLNGNLLKEKITCSHDKNYNYSFDVKDGEIIELEIECKEHKHHKQQLNEIINAYTNKFNDEIFHLLNNSKTSEFDYQFEIKIRNVKTKENNIELINNSNTDNIKIAPWMCKDNAIGYMIESNNYSQEYLLNSLADGNVLIAFLGINHKINNELAKIYADYESIKINGKEILKDPKIAWHNEPFRHNINVKKGQTIRISVQRNSHIYSANELVNLLDKQDVKSYEEIIKINQPYYKNKFIAIKKHSDKTSLYVFGKRIF